MATKKVLLINMPFGAIDRPALGLSLLKSWLHQYGYECAVQYFTFSFAEYIGIETYYEICSEVPYTAFVSEWIFAQALYGEDVNRDLQYIENILRREWHLEDSAIQKLCNVRQFVPHFLEYCYSSVRWNDYILIGFTSTFQQNIASLSLAKRVKEKFPDITIVFGGANWEVEMGIELLRKFPFVDYACSGEADKSFPTLVKFLISGKDEEIGHILGIIYQRNGTSFFTGPAEPIHPLDEVPIPDYNDYFEGLMSCTVSSQIIPTLLVETARGCWWGQKRQCSFCGLNGGSLVFRSKSAERIETELDYLTHRWNFDFVEVVDNILDPGYFHDLFPRLMTKSLNLFFEVKANLTRQQVRLLKEAGVCHIQPGIESLNDHILKLMNKGTSALKNIQLLKWCKEYGIKADWNILYGTPGETEEDYESMLDILPSIRFLTPPNACGPIRLDRFSPYFRNPTKYRLSNIRPLNVYKYIYPFDNYSLKRIAYYFNYEHATESDPFGKAQKVISFVTSWQKTPERGVLYSLDKPDGTLCLLDTRLESRRQETVLSGMEKTVYQFCDSQRSIASVVAYLRKKYSSAHFSQKQVARFLNSLVANGLMVKNNHNYLSLALNVDLTRGS